MSEVRSRVAKGAAWMLAARALDRGLGLISTLILVRLLVPDDFGIIAMAMSVIGLLGLLRSFGFDVVLIQHRAPQRIHYDTAWTINVAVSIGLSLLLAGLAFPAAAFYREPALTNVMLCLALAPAITGLQNIGVVDFRKNLEFHRDFRLVFFSRLLRFAVTVPLAFALRNEWALVLGILFGDVIGVALSYVLHPYRPRPSLAAWQELFGFSRWLVAKNLVQVLTQRSADFVVGRVAGPRSLGLFNVSYEVAFLPSSELAAPINRALFPGYARQATEPGALGRGFLDVVSVIWLLVLPAAAGMMATADFMVPVLMGREWLEAIPLVPVLALHGLLNGLGSNTASIFYAQGRPRVVTVVAILQLAVLLPCLLLGVSRAGALGAAWAYVASSLAVVPLSYAILVRELRIPLRILFGRIWRPAVATALMAFGVRAVAGRLPDTQLTPELLGQLLVLVFLGAGIYVLTTLALWVSNGRPEGAERFALSLARDLVARLVSRARSA